MTFGTWRWCGQPHAPAAFTPRKCSWYSFSLGAESTPGPWHVGRNISLKSPVTPPGIDPGTVRLVAQRLNHYATQGPAAVIYRYLYTVLLSSGRRKIFFSQTFLCLCGCNLLALHRLRGGGAKQPAREDDHSLLPRLRMSETIPSVPPHALTLPHKNICNRSAMIYWPQPLPLWFFPSIRQLFHLAVDSVLSHNVLLFLRTLLCHVLHLQQSFTHSIVLSFNTKCAGHMPVYSVYCPKLVRVRVQLKCDGTRWRTGRKGKGKLANGVGSQYSHTTSEHGVCSIITADVHTSAASSLLNWRHHRIKWTRPFRRKTKSGFCACAITFQTQSTTYLSAVFPVLWCRYTFSTWTQRNCAFRCKWLQKAFCAAFKRAMF